MNSVLNLNFCEGEWQKVTTTAVVVLGALCGGVVTGLAGFGTGLTALAFWLHVVNPVVAAALVVSCSVVAQVQSLYTVRRAINWSRAWPFLAGGIIGVPLGVASLQIIAPQALKVFLGLFLIGYTGVMLGFRRFPTTAWGGRVADGIIGLGGGALGGLAGLSGPLPTIWCGLRGWNADAQRAVYQPFNLIILAIVLCTYITRGYYDGRNLIAGLYVYSSHRFRSLSGYSCVRACEQSTVQSNGALDVVRFRNCADIVQSRLSKNDRCRFTSILPPCSAEGGEVMTVFAVLVTLQCPILAHLVLRTQVCLLPGTIASRVVGRNIVSIHLTAPACLCFPSRSITSTLMRPASGARWAYLSVMAIALWPMNSLTR